MVSKYSWVRRSAFCATAAWALVSLINNWRIAVVESTGVFKGGSRDSVGSTDAGELGSLTLGGNSHPDSVRFGSTQATVWASISSS